MTNSDKKIWDVIVIGGGPAGMMAAGTAALRGKSVLLLEKNSSLGVKLLITGGGRCNLTNNKTDNKELVESYRGTPKALFSVFSKFGVTDTLDFFHSRKMETKEESEGRMFPESNKAESVWEVMQNYTLSSGVTVKTKSSVIGIVYSENDQIFEITTNTGIKRSKSCIVATGGTSHPETGSTGEGFKWLQTLGHTIIQNRSALVPIAIKNDWVKELPGLVIQNVTISILLDGKKHESIKGKVLFTHFGLSGPTILNMSSKIGELLPQGLVNIGIDLHPKLDQGQLKMELHNLLTKESNKQIKNSLGQLAPKKLVHPLLKIAGIDPEKPNHSITKEERKNIRLTLKAIPLTVSSLLGADKAVVSSGGVKIDEVNFQTMESKMIPGLYTIGDVLDIDRPSGGYSLQICWSTGFVAGSNC